MIILATQKDNIKTSYQGCCWMKKVNFSFFRASPWLQMSTDSMKTMYLIHPLLGVAHLWTMLSNICFRKACIGHLIHRTKLEFYVPTIVACLCTSLEYYPSIGNRFFPISRYKLNFLRLNSFYGWFGKSFSVYIPLIC